MKFLTPSLFLLVACDPTPPQGGQSGTVEEGNCIETNRETIDTSEPADGFDTTIDASIAELDGTWLDAPDAPSVTLSLEALPGAQWVDYSVREMNGPAPAIDCPDAYEIDFDLALEMGSDLNEVLTLPVSIDPGGVASFQTTLSLGQITGDVQPELDPAEWDEVGLQISGSSNATGLQLTVGFTAQREDPAADPDGPVLATTHFEPVIEVELTR